MVRTKKALHRAAFTLIELVFAIIIISISIVSLPIIMQINAEGVEKSIVQEAIFAASAELMGATSYYWDARSIEDINISHLSRVIDVNGDCNATTRQRVGHVNRRCLDSNATVANYTAEDAVTTNFGLNRSVHVAGDMFDNIVTEASGYKQSYKSKMEIAKGNDINGTQSDNVKVLTVTVTDPNDINETLTSLKIFSANIGEVPYYKRRF